MNGSKQIGGNWTLEFDRGLLACYQHPGHYDIPWRHADGRVVFQKPDLVPDWVQWHVIQEFDAGHYDNDLTKSAGKIAYDSFDGYAKDIPGTDKYQAWVRHNGRPVVIVKGYGPHGSLPGGYVWACTSFWAVHVHDNDDGQLDKQFDSAEEAERGLRELMELAPFAMSDLEAIGYFIP